MLKFIYTIRKEALILLRDKAGLIILFLMPTVLIVIMSLLQEFGYSSVSRETQVNVLFLDHDGDSLGYKIRTGLMKAGYFNLIDSVDGKPATDSSIRDAVKKGKYVVGVVIPKGVTKKIRSNVKLMVAKTMAGFGLYDQRIVDQIPFGLADTITLYFDPTVKKSFQYGVVSSLKQYNYQIESEMIFSTFNQELSQAFPTYRPPALSFKDAVEFQEEYPSYHEVERIPDSAEHNVPAWTVFAMFFIIIPLTSSMIIEREAGSQFRLMAMPVTYMQLLMAKVFVYLLVCFLQAVLMMLAGMYLLPIVNVTPLVLADNIFSLVVITVMTALAALGYGVLVGTIAGTHQQAAAFGAVSIIIMAAMGGLWVPTYLMNPAMQHFATFSPLNWALNGYYTIFLRGGGLREIFPDTLKLLIFFLVMVSGTAYYRKLKNPMNK
ncbi:MAG: ABC transporter permease [Alphaproteobacteria bacterium]|nr:ABC transporter permease [Alphaproteobacteria bacterium]